MQYLNQFFHNLWLTENHSKVFQCLYQYGEKPASTIANIVDLERTHTYKLLQGLVRKWIISSSQKGGVTHFFITDKQLFTNLLLQKKQELQSLDQQIPQIQLELSTLTQHNPLLPKIQIFEWQQWLSQVFASLLDYLREHNFVTLKMFASNTLDSQIGKRTFQTIWQHFLQTLAKHNITVEAYLGNGIMILEHLIKTTNIQEISQLPAGQSAINIFVVGNRIYHIIYADRPSAIMIENEPLSSAYHFFFSLLWEKAKE